jgi:hypothetical protein
MNNNFENRQIKQKLFVENILDDEVLFEEFIMQVEEDLIQAPLNLKQEILTKSGCLEKIQSEHQKRKQAWFQFISYSLKVSAGTVAALFFLLFFMQFQKQEFPGSVVKFEGFQKKFEENFESISYELRTSGDYRMKKSYQDRLSKQDDKK